MQRYEHSVVEMSAAIWASVTGSGDPLPPDGDKRGRAWLLWRITEGWLPSTHENWRPYEDAVRAMARAALEVK